MLKPATAYRRGRYFEYQVARHLRQDGWKVWRTPGSKSPADLICLKPGRHILLVQCKADARKHATEALAELAMLIGCEAALAIRDGGRIVWKEVC